MISLSTKVKKSLVIGFGVAALLITGAGTASAEESSIALTCKQTLTAVSFMSLKCTIEALGMYFDAIKGNNCVNNYTLQFLLADPANNVTQHFISSLVVTGFTFVTTIPLLIRSFKKGA